MGPVYAHAPWKLIPRLVPLVTRIRLFVKMGAGLPDEIATWATGGSSGCIDFDDDEMRICQKQLPSTAPFAATGAPDERVYLRGPKRHIYSLADIRFLAYESAGTKSNVGALVAFGVLGLGSRKSWTLLTIGFMSTEGQFLIRAPLHEIRSLLQRASASSPTLESLVNEGPPPTTMQKDPPEILPSKLDELERLASLYQQGFLSEDEFARMKTDVLDGE